MEKKEIIRKLKEILSKHEGNTSEGAIYWDFEWVGGKQIPDGMGGYEQIGVKRVSAEEAFYKEMTDFISKELDKAREEGYQEGKEYQAKLDREIYGMSFEEFDKKWKPVSKLKDNK